MRSHAFAAALLAVTLAACDSSPARQGPATPAAAPAPSCDDRDRDLAPGRTQKVCVLIGHGSVVRLAHDPAGPERAAKVVICNTATDVERVYVAWAEAGNAPGDRAAWTADRIWEQGQSHRRTIAAGQCTEAFGPVRAVVLRGWQDGGQGYDVGASWEGTVRFVSDGRQ